MLNAGRANYEKTRKKTFPKSRYKLFIWKTFYMENAKMYFH